MSALQGDSAPIPPAGRLVGYARVSTADQNTSLQRDALLGAGCTRLFVDKDASGANRARPALTKALRYLRAGDTLIVWKLDRLARSLQDLLDIAGDLQGRGIAFESLTEKLDTSTAHGEFAFHMIAAVAQMVLMQHVPFDHIGDRFKAAMGVRREAGQVVRRLVGAKLIQHQERIQPNLLGLSQ